MNKQRSKKGFTLAELLIVVAIIAVLVAIAVPLFVSALGKAQQARDDANIRAVRGAAVVRILNTDKAKDELHHVFQADGTLYAYYTVTATIDSTGNFVGEIEITGATSDTSWDANAKTRGGKVEANGDKYNVTAYITSLDLAGVTSSKPSSP